MVKSGKSLGPIAVGTRIALVCDKNDKTCLLCMDSPSRVLGRYDTAAEACLKLAELFLARVVVPDGDAAICLARKVEENRAWIERARWGR